MGFLSVIAGAWLVFFLATPALAENEECIPYPLGVEIIQEEPSKIYISVAKSMALSQDEGSFLLAEAEARLESKRNLIEKIYPAIKKMTLSGLVNISVCRINNEVFATLKFDEENIKRANRIKELINSSSQVAPTPKP